MNYDGANLVHFVCKTIGATGDAFLPNVGGICFASAGLYGGLTFLA